MTITEDAVILEEPAVVDADGVQRPKDLTNGLGIVAGAVTIVAGGGLGAYLNSIEFSIPLLLGIAGGWLLVAFIVAVLLGDGA